MFVSRRQTLMIPSLFIHPYFRISCAELESRVTSPMRENSVGKGSIGQLRPSCGLRVEVQRQRDRTILPRVVRLYMADATASIFPYRSLIDSTCQSLGSCTRRRAPLHEWSSSHRLEPSNISPCVHVHVLPFSHTALVHVHGGS